jgi:hypothetical protein
MLAQWLHRCHIHHVVISLFSAYETVLLCSLRSGSKRSREPREEMSTVPISRKTQARGKISTARPRRASFLNASGVTQARVNEPKVPVVLVVSSSGTIFRDAEVGEVSRVVLDEDVGGFDVPMLHPHLVHVFESTN